MTNPTPTLLEAVNALTKEEARNPFTIAFAFSLVILDELNRMGKLVDTLSDYTQGEIVSILQDVKTIQFALKVHPSKLRNLATRISGLVDGLESSYSGDPDGSATMRFAQVRAALERRAR